MIIFIPLSIPVHPRSTGLVGFEPTNNRNDCLCRSQSPVPYRLAIAQCARLTHPILHVLPCDPTRRCLCRLLTFPSYFNGVCYIKLLYKRRGVFDKTPNILTQVTLNKCLDINTKLFIVVLNHIINIIFFNHSII